MALVNVFVAIHDDALRRARLVLGGVTVCSTLRGNIKTSLELVDQLKEAAEEERNLKDKWKVAVGRYAEELSGMCVV